MVQGADFGDFWKVCECLFKSKRRNIINESLNKIEVQPKIRIETFR